MDGNDEDPGATKKNEATSARPELPELSDVLRPEDDAQRFASSGADSTAATGLTKRKRKGKGRRGGGSGGGGIGTRLEPAAVPPQPQGDEFNRASNLPPGACDVSPPPPVSDDGEQGESPAANLSGGAPGASPATGNGDDDPVAVVPIAHLVEPSSVSVDGYRDPQHRPESERCCGIDCTSRRTKVKAGLLLLGALVIAAVIVAVVVGSGGGASSSGTSASPTPAPTTLAPTTPAPTTPAPTRFIDSVRQQILTVTSEDDLNDPTSHQRQAFTWITEADTYELGSGDSNVLQRYGLATMYFALGGTSWTERDNWMKGFHECSWENVKCDKEGEFALDLRFNDINMAGTLPSEILALTTLTSLQFDSNDVRGSIPKDIGTLSNLRLLVFRDNPNFSGVIPTEVGFLMNLTQIDLTGTKVRGTIPTEIGNMTSLGFLQLFNTELGGAVPLDTIASMKSLYWIELGTDDQRNALNFGTRIPTKYSPVSIPTEMGKMNLITLKMNAVYLVGSIPTEIGNTGLAYLEMYSNFLIGTLPTELGSLARLRSLELNLNNLQGTVPEEYGNLAYLETFRIEVNERLMGTLPPSVCTETKVPSVWGVWITCNVQCCVNCCSLCLGSGRPTDLCNT